jgi:folate-binding protein YgfZ
MFWLNKNAIILKVSGPHANRYLNARLTNDLRTPIASSIQAAILTPQGKCEGLFTCIRIDSDQVILVCDGGVREEVIAAFKRYIVADRLDVTEVSSEYELIHVYQMPAELNLQKEFDSQVHEYGMIIARQRSANLGVDILKNKNTQIPWCHLDEINSERAHYLRVLAKIPAYPQELRDRLFLEAPLNNCISSSKGCYTGQEVVERILSHGKSPKILLPIDFQESGANVGDRVIVGDLAVGEVVSVYSSEPMKPLGFVTIKNDPAISREALKVNGSAIATL